MSKSNLESYFEYLLHTMAPDLPKPKRELRFHPTRRWRFDFAFPSAKLAIECDGGQWRKFGGRHARDSDREKLNEAAVLGWRVLRFSGAMLRNNPKGCIKQVCSAFHLSVRQKSEVRGHKFG